MTLREEIAQAEATLAALKRQEATATCGEVGHRWKFIGGSSACCRIDGTCGCSVPVHECDACGDCDYGEPMKAETIARCNELR